MKITTKARYAVTALADLAYCKECDPVCLARIAERQGISLAYLEQLFCKMRRAGLVESVRGPGGGYLLSRDAAEISIADIVAAVNESLRATRCKPSDEQGCGSKGEKCMTHDLWAALEDHVDLFFASVSLHHVINGAIPRANPFMFDHTEPKRQVALSAAE